jgi:hypothetical protein
LAGLILILAQVALFYSALATTPAILLLIIVSGLASLLLADVTYYFNLYRSWVSGTLAMPFAFAVGLTLLLRTSTDRVTRLLHLLTVCCLALVVACVAFNHYHDVCRDRPPSELTARFKTQKLRHILSTPKRVQAIDQLCAYLGPKLSRGEALLAYDQLPMLYYLLDAKPAYAMTWAARFNPENHEVLAQFDREFRAQPLPRYAIRTMVNVAFSNWEEAQYVSYENYPINQTVEENYVLEKTFFPFEIFRLKTDLHQARGP